MKNVIKNSKKFFLSAAILIATLGYANTIEESMVNKEAALTALTLANVKKGNSLSIKDQNGIIVYKELIAKSGNYTKGFDLTALPDGNYFFELDKMFP